MSENEQEKKKVTNSNLDIKLWAVGSVLFILMSVFGYFAYLNLHFPPTERENYATLGDSFGILSSLFSGLAFAGLIVTIVMQNKTLKAQMEELELARKEYKRQGDELQGQKDVMNKQFEAIQIQQFEATFFKMIDNHRSIVGQMYIEGSSGKRCFKKLTEIFLEKDDVHNHFSDYLDIYIKYESDLSVYFRSFYNVLNFIDGSAISDESKIKYSKLFRFEFNDEELGIIIRNCAFFGSSGKVIELIEKYYFLKNFSIYSVYYDEFTVFILCNQFKMKAYGSRREAIKKDILKVKDKLKGKDWGEDGFENFINNYMETIAESKKNFI